MYSASKQPGNLSQSALSYLQSLEKATKALRRDQQVEKKGSVGQHSLRESSRLSGERGSLSSMISQLRHRTQKESTIEESDDDESISEQHSQMSEKTPSISPSSAGGERIVFDFPFDTAKDDGKRNDALPKEELPGLPVRRKSVLEIRELRSSIDHSLIKPPKLQRQQPRRLSINSYKEDSESGDHLGSEEEPKVITPKPYVAKQKSPFRPAIESGSDLESIDFEEATSPTKSVHFKDQVEPVPSSASSGSSHRRSSKSSSSTTSSSSSSRSSKSRSTSEDSSSKSTVEDAVSDATSESSTFRGSPENEKHSESSRRSSKDHNYSQGSDEFDSSDENETRTRKGKETKDKRKNSISVQSKKNLQLSVDGSTLSLSSEDTPSIVVSTRKIPRRRSTGSNESQKSTSTIRKKDGSRRKSMKSSKKMVTSEEPRIHDPPSTMPRSRLYTAPIEHSTQTETSGGNEPERLPEFCSTNLHHVTRDVLKTHLHLLKEFNRLEFSSLQEWNAILDDIRQKYDGPSTEKLRTVIEKRANRP